jgi:hypothetical protein
MGNLAMVQEDEDIDEPGGGHVCGVVIPVRQKSPTCPRAPSL